MIHTSQITQAKIRRASPIPEQSQEIPSARCKHQTLQDRRCNAHFVLHPSNRITVNQLEVMQQKPAYQQSNQQRRQGGKASKACFGHPGSGETVGRRRASSNCSGVSTERDVPSTLKVAIACPASIKRSCSRRRDLPAGATIPTHSTSPRKTSLRGPSKGC